MAPTESGCRDAPWILEIRSLIPKKIAEALRRLEEAQYSRWEARESIEQVIELGWSSDELKPYKKQMDKTLPISLSLSALGVI